MPRSQAIARISLRLRPWSVAVVAVSAVLCAVRPVAAEQRPFEQHSIELARQAEREGRSPEGMIPLLELWQASNDVDPALTRRLLEQLDKSPRLSPARRAYVGSLLANADAREGKLEQARTRVHDLGFVTNWRVVGSFDNEGKAGFDAVQPPEANAKGPVQVTATWPGKERPVSWRAYPESSTWLGYVDLDAVLRPNNNVCAFAETSLVVDRDRPLTLWVGAGGAVKVWWNGQQVLADGKYRGADPDRDVALVGAHKGPNRLMVKVCIADTRWGFYLRTGDAQGAPLVLEADPKAGVNTKVTVAKARLPKKAPEAPLRALEKAAQGDHPSPDALTTLAKFLAYTGADDPAVHRARDLASQAADLKPTVDRLRLAASLADQRSQVMRFIQRAVALAPKDPRVLIMQARLASSGPMPENALPFLDQVPAGGRPALEAALIRADVLDGFNLPDSALQVLEKAASKAPRSVRFERALLNVVSDTGDDDRAHTLQEALLKLRYDDLGVRRALLGDALQRGDTDEVDRHLVALERLATTPSELSYIAHVREALGQNAQALEAFDQARVIAPEAHGILVAYGKMLLRMGQKQAAVGVLHDALSLKPQDASTRELLEQIEKPEKRRDERYAVGEKELLARRVKASGYPVTILQQLTVNTVYQNGLGSSFEQVAAQIHDDSGARQWRTYSIRFDPSSQRVQIRRARVYRKDGSVLEASRTFVHSLGEPWYRVYYDTRAMVVVFPDLQPGDVVELRYRIDDIAHRNLFANYYGDLQFIQGFQPVRHFEYILMTPKERKFYWHIPKMKGLEHHQSVEGDQRIDRFVANDVPAIRPEDGMPGMTEISPFFHVSTYKSWTAVGKWYWGLIKDQLHLDDSLKKTVADLIAGAKDDREKVTRIHDWVVKNIRYVGLEFGIHGYKPYRVSQIVERGFGDCKDKASLLYAMFEEAGIDAHIVLVRTRQNGNIPDLPASLAVFDHAITYVPSLDLYIDGTAEHSGITELPQQDQGAVVLQVWPTGAKLERTPVLPPEQERRTRILTAKLRPDGSATIQVQGEVRGDTAGAYRDRYQAEGTRSDRFEDAMRDVFPGFELKSLSFDSLEDLEQPVRFHYQAVVPQFAHVDGGGLRMAPSVLDDLMRGLAPTATRQYPLDLGGTTSYVEERTVEMPAGWHMAAAPSSGDATSKFGRLTMQVEQHGSSINVRTDLELTADRIAPEQYPAFRKWVQSAAALLRQRYRFVEGK